MPRIFIHGLMSSGKGYKGQLLRRALPGILTPDFSGDLDERMQQLAPILSSALDWTIIGSSFGGLMGALFTCSNPLRVSRLILLAPALTHPRFADSPPKPIRVPTVVYHGRYDDLIPLAEARTLAEQVFSRLTFHDVDDDHRLHKTVEDLDWPKLAGL